METTMTLFPSPDTLSISTLSSWMRFLIELCHMYRYRRRCNVTGTNASSTILLCVFDFSATVLKHYCWYVSAIPLRFRRSPRVSCFSL